MDNEDLLWSAITHKSAKALFSIRKLPPKTPSPNETSPNSLANEPCTSSDANSTTALIPTPALNFKSLRDSDYEKLEWLGDAVLEWIVAHDTYFMYRKTRADFRDKVLGNEIPVK